MEISNVVKYILIGVAIFIFITALPMLILRVKSGKISRTNSIIVGSVLLIIIFILFIIAFTSTISNDDDGKNASFITVESSQEISDLKTVNIAKSSLNSDGNVFVVMNDDDNFINIFGKNFTSNTFSLPATKITSVDTTKIVSRISVNNASVFFMYEADVNVYRQNFTYDEETNVISLINNIIVIDTSNITSQPIEFLIDDFNQNLMVGQDLDALGCVLKIFDSVGKNLIQTLEFSTSSFGRNLFVSSISLNTMIIQTRNVGGVGSKLSIFKRENVDERWTRLQDYVFADTGLNASKNLLVGNDILLCGQINISDGTIKDIKTFIRNNDNLFNFEDSIDFTQPDPRGVFVKNWSASLQAVDNNNVVLQAFDEDSKNIITYASKYNQTTNSWSLNATEIFVKNSEFTLNSPYTNNLIGNFGVISSKTNKNNTVCYIAQPISEIPGVSSVNVIILNLKL
jgi:energy-coupling factor transporter transmembrane protein EcfT